MRTSSSFIIPAAPHEVFDRFLDQDTLKSCIPGCHELERLDDSHYRGQLMNEVAHVRFNASFAAEIVELERPRLVRAVLTGEDRRLGSSVKLTANLDVEPLGDEGSAVSYQMDLALWGKLGRLGEPIIRRRSAEVEREFVAAFRTTFEPQPAPEPEPALPTGPPAASGPASRKTLLRARIRTLVLVVLRQLRARLDSWIEALG